MQSQIDVIEPRGYFQRRAFFHLPWKIYRGDPHWVPPLLVQVKESLNTRKNPFYRYSELKLFLALKRGRPAGRIAAIVNAEHNRFHDEKAGFFGFFECTDDPAVSAALLDGARQWLASRAMTVMRGPANPSTNHECGLLVDGFDMPPQVMMPYNPPYYARLFESYGLRKAKDLYAYRIQDSDFTPQFQKLADSAAKRAGIEVRSLDVRRFDAEARMIMEIYNRAWERNWGFVPVDKVEFMYLARQMKQILEPSLALIGLVNGKPAGFSLTLPNMNEALKHVNGRLFPFGLIKLMFAMKNISSCRNLLMGVTSEHRKIGLDLVLYKHTIDAGSKLGYKWGELSWILEDNTEMRRVIEKIGAVIYKTYRFYEMPTGA